MEPTAPPADTSPGGSPVPASPDDAIRWYAIPNFAYNTDDGYGFGARGELALGKPPGEPYRQAFVIHLFATDRGYQQHKLRYDRIGLFGRDWLRLTAYGAWRQWLNDGFWGIGNDTRLDRAFVGPFDSHDPARKRYAYKLFQPFLHVTLRAHLGGPWSVFSSVNPKWSDVQTYKGSLLEEQRPFGIDGGFTTLVSTGVLYDTREPEVTPRRGVLLELSGRVAPPLPKSAGTFGGGFFSARGYLSLAPRLVLAGRAMTELLLGDIPFYEMVHWGGFVPVSGFGGADTLRGIPFGRWRAPGKALGNLELRIDVVDHTLLGSPVTWELVPYADAGLAYGQGSGFPGPMAIHPSAGLGVRVIYQEVFVGRVDSGFGIDQIREPDGSVSRTSTFGLYIVFEHLF